MMTLVSQTYKQNCIHYFVKISNLVLPFYSIIQPFSDTNIATVPTDTFSGFSNLEILNLAKNDIEQVDSNAFNGLINLDLSENALT